MDEKKKTYILLKLWNIWNRALLNVLDKIGGFP